MVKSVTLYQASDGTEHASEAEALGHEAITKIAKILSKHVGSRIADKSIIAAHIVNHAHEIIPALQTVAVNGGKYLFNPTPYQLGVRDKPEKKASKGDGGTVIKKAAA